MSKNIIIKTEEETKKMIDIIIKIKEEINIIEMMTSNKKKNLSNMKKLKKSPLKMLKKYKKS